MECGLEYRQLASRNSFIQELEQKGYQLDFVGSHLILYGVPYLDCLGSLLYGDIASPVDIKGDHEIDVPSNHQVWFSGQAPHGMNGNILPVSANPNPITVTEALKFPTSFSFKIKDDDGQMRQYESFAEKIFTYLEVVSAPAREKFHATPKRLRDMAAQIKSPLRFSDTMSARDGINELSHKLLGIKVGIVGLGGTGGYILDFIAKTHLEVIRIFDDDIIHEHTLFRMPGAYGSEALGRKKVDVFYNVYNAFHDGIEPHAVKIGEANIDLLLDLDFVFLAIDDGPSRSAISHALHEACIPFVDTGMGLRKSPEGLNGMIRLSGGDVADAKKLIGTAYLPAVNPADNEYRRQPQIGELNALNAALAVIRFKQAFNIFERDTTSSAHILEIETLDIDHYQK